MKQPYHTGGIVTQVPHGCRMGWFLNPRTGQMQELYEWQTKGADRREQGEISAAALPPTIAHN